jgi:hypothetical protein
LDRVLLPGAVWFTLADGSSDRAGATSWACQHPPVAASMSHAGQIPINAAVFCAANTSLLAAIESILVLQ